MVYHKSEIDDPSDIQQQFAAHSVQLLCCRYWWLKRWESSNMAIPYWRVYWNRTPGAYIQFNQQEISLIPGIMILIPPNTPFIGYVDKSKLPPSGFLLKGGRIDSEALEQSCIDDSLIRHLFIHFNLPLQNDYVSPQIMSIPITSSIQGKLESITCYLQNEVQRFNLYITMQVHALITEALASVPHDQWHPMTKDRRIITVFHYIQQQIDASLHNEELAKQVNLATNAFTRLFTHEVGESPQRYVKRQRIDKACMWLHHSDFSIEEIARRTGFADRFHFSRVFKQITGLAPAAYKKGLGEIV